MLPPSPPTDNLYKFIALSGIAICIATVSLFLLASQGLLDKSNQAQETSAVLQVEINDLNAHHTSLIKDYDRLNKKIDKDRKTSSHLKNRFEVLLRKREGMTRLQDLDTRLELAVVMTSLANSEQRIKDQTELEKQQERVDLDLKKKRALQDVKDEQLRYLHSQWWINIISEVGLLLFGIQLGYHGFRLWYVHSQRYMDLDAKVSHELAMVNLEAARVSLEKARLDLEAAKNSEKPTHSAPASGLTLLNLARRFLRL